jgi:hypothetical protein
MAHSQTEAVADLNAGVSEDIWGAWVRQLTSGRGAASTSAVPAALRLS